MASNVNVFITNFHSTGKKVQVPQYSVHLKFDWVDSSGRRNLFEKDVLFPNILTEVPPPFLREKIENIMVEFFRKIYVEGE